MRSPWHVWLTKRGCFLHESFRAIYTHGFAILVSLVLGIAQHHGGAIRHIVSNSNWVGLTLLINGSISNRSTIMTIVL